MKILLLIFSLFLASGPICDACVAIPGTSMGGGGGIAGPHDKKKCLHVNSRVLMADGKSYKKAGDLSIGDRVWGENGPTPIILTPIAQMEDHESFIEFRTEKGFGTTLTPNHAVFARPCGIDGQDSWPVKKSIDLNLGECVPTVDGREDKVVSVKAMELVGRIQPITGNGKIAVDGVFVSCYDHDQGNTTQEEKHAPYHPARVFYQWAEKIYYSMTNEEHALGILDGLIRSLGLEKLYYE